MINGIRYRTQYKPAATPPPSGDTRVTVSGDTRIDFSGNTRVIAGA